MPQGKTFRYTPFLPYLNYPPKDWSLALRFTGGGLDGAGAISIDHYGNIWVTNNFLSGSQSGLQPNLLGGGISKLAPNGYPISPETFGYRGGGVDGPGFGQAIDHQGNIWVGSVHGKCLSKFDGRTGKPLSPPDGYTLGGRLGKIQGIMVTHRNDVWALDNSNNRLVQIANAEVSKAKILCERSDCGLIEPFDLAIDNKERIWVSNGNAHWVTRFDANNPTQVEKITTGYEGKGIAIDSMGNAWQSNFSSSPRKQSKDLLDVFANQLKDQLEGKNTGSIAMITSQGQVSMFHSTDIVGPWGIAIDGDDHVWIADFTGRAVTKLCGVQKTTPQGHKPGDVITQFLGGGLQHLTDIVIDQAGNVWVANNWDHMASCLAQKPSDIDSTRCGGNGVVVYYGLAKTCTRTAIWTTYEALASSRPFL